MPETSETVVTPVAPVAPAPVTPEVVVVKPVVDEAIESNKRQANAFYKQRTKLRAVAQELAALKAVPVAPPVVPVVAQPAPAVTLPSAPAQAEDIVGEKEAIDALAADQDVCRIPGAVIDILESVDNSPRLSRLYQIDPVIALREAKGLWAGKLGIASTPVMPLASISTGGQSGSGSQDLDAIYQAFVEAKPGSKEYHDLAKRYEAALARKK